MTEIRNQQRDLCEEMKKQRLQEFMAVSLLLYFIYLFILLYFLCIIISLNLVLVLCDTPTMIDFTYFAIRI